MHARAHRSQKRARADQFALKERSEKKVIKIENKEQTILGLLANFEHDWSMHARTGAKNVRAHNHSAKNAQQAWAELCQA